MKIHKTFCCEDLNQLPSDQLDRMLHEALNEEVKDADLIKALMRILEEREAGKPAPDMGVDWQRFVERYNTTIAPEPSRHRRKPLRWIGVVAAAIALCFVASFAVPKAAGYDNIFALIASWTEDIFRVSDPEAPTVSNEYVFETDNPDLQRIYDAVTEVGITEPVVPTWIPEGYQLEEFKNVSVADGTYIHAKFTDVDSYVMLSIAPKDTSTGRVYPKDDIDVDTIELHNVKHYTCSNDGMSFAIWTIDTWECRIVTNQNEIIKKLIYSIYEVN